MNGHLIFVRPRCLFCLAAAGSTPCPVRLDLSQRTAHPGERALMTGLVPIDILFWELNSLSTKTNTEFEPIKFLLNLFKGDTAFPSPCRNSIWT